MSHVYDNWERLVAAVVKKQQLWELFHAQSRDSSFSSVSTDFTSTFSGRISLDLSSDQLDVEFPIRLGNNHLDHLPEPLNVPSVSQINKTSRAAFRFGVPTTGFAWYRRKKTQNNFFVTEVPRLYKSEIESACEDFTNVLIGSSPTYTLYKGTLSSGVELAVASLVSADAGHWSNSSEVQFRNKIETLSKMYHNNFINILGYCTEEKPLTKMIVLEYVPNGTLFEYLHIIEAERLDWETRLRIAMGMAYCLEHMHRLTSPLVMENLTTLDVYLTEDYAAKLSDFLTWDKGTSSAEIKANMSGNVYSFGVILFEMITGKLPFTVGSDSCNWLLDYLRGSQLLREMVDPTLESYKDDQLEQIGFLIKWCANSDLKERPTMREVCELLYRITAIEPDEASPKHLVQEAEIQILTIDAS